MSLLFLYLIAAFSCLIPVGLYFLFSKTKLASDKKVNVLLKVVSVITIVALISCFYHLDSRQAMMSWDAEAPGTLRTDIGCLNLIGVPYGDNRVGNFFAWLSNALFYPGMFMVACSIFLPNKSTKLINKYIQLPIAGLEFVTLFNLVNALKGSIIFDYESIFIATSAGFGLSLSIMTRIKDNADSKVTSWKEVVNMIGFFLIAVIAFLPTETKSVLFATDGLLFGKPQAGYRVYDLSQLHRMYIYLAIFGYILLYFLFRDTSREVRKVLLLVLAVGSLRVVTQEFNAHEMFPIVDGALTVNVKRLPIHLCNTAMYVVPLCIAFNNKRLFYFTYFINVFGAICAIFAPNVGEYSNCFSPSVVVFWFNHFAAFGMPLLCVALKLFDRPKYKQMIWSLVFFAFYFALIMFMNAWFSNYTPGGTDYLFINSDFILKKLFNEADTQNILNNTFSWTWGDLSFTIRPLYQSLFFGVYVAIAFCMWFVYSLFFRIADSHYELMCLLKVARKENIKMRDRNKMIITDIEEKEVCLHFDDFSKRYGSSPVLSADHVQLKVKGGQIFGFLGPNGAGKSTCIKTAIGIQPITEGNIYVCGYDVKTQPVVAKRQIGYVPDHYALYEKLTGREYINYIADLYNVSKKDRTERINKYVDLFELSHAFDNRMQTYSHGMKQKIAIMAALVHNPKIWILDEPLTGLDPQSIFQVKECMKEHAAKGNIVFFSSHIIEVVEKLCTRIAIIKKGHIVYEADMKDLEKEHPEGLEAFYLETIHEGEEKEPNEQ